MADPVKEFEAYRQELLELLAGADPLEVLGAMPATLEARIADLDDDTVDRRPPEGGWTVKEVVGHLSDTEWVYGYRVRLMLSHDTPTMPGYDQDLMVDGMAHGARSVSELLEEFRHLRGFNLELYERTRGPAWDRVGLHGERGEESVELTIRLLAGHDLRHLRQIERIVERVTRDPTS